MAEKKSKWAGIDRAMLLLAGIVLLGAAIRLLPVLYSVIGGQVLFNGPDSSYHVRRIVYTAMHYPFPNLFDSYVRYPDGYSVGWPPLFDVLGATIALIAGLGSPNVFTMEAAASLLPVLIGAATIPVIYYLVRDLLNEKVALIAALIYAIIPGGVFRSLFAVVDHHGLEVLVSLALFLLFMRSVVGAKKTGLSLSSLRHPKPLGYAALAGIAAACMILSWDGAPIFIGIIAAYAFVQYTYDALNGESSEYLTVPGIAASAGALAVMLAMGIAGSLGYPWMWPYAAWFQTVFLGCVLAYFIVMGLMAKVIHDRSLPWYALPAAAVGLGIAGTAIAWLLVPGFFPGVRSGIFYLAGLDAVTGTISEAELLFISGGRISAIVPWAYFSLLGPVAILGLLLYLLSARDKKAGQAEVFLLVWAVAVIALGLMQKRFINTLAVGVSVFGGYALYRTLELAGLEEYLRPSKSKKPSASRSGSISTALLSVSIVAVLLLLPALMSSIALALTPEYYALDWNDACQWVSENTPKTSFLYSADTGTHPEYGVMSWWDYGNYVIYRGQRPAVANNFQTGVNYSAEFFVTPDEAAASAIMDNRSAKYALLDYRMGSLYAGVPYGIFDSIALLAGENASDYHGKAASLNRSANEKYYDTMYSRLFNFDGCGGNSGSYAVEPLEHYRLIYGTRGSDPVKVFEYVKGAIIVGNARPGSDVSIRLKVTTPYGEREYANTTSAGSDGHYRFVVPYATSVNGPVVTDTAYTVTSGGSSARVAVPDSAVLAGDTLPA